MLNYCLQIQVFPLTICNWTNSTDKSTSTKEKIDLIGKLLIFLAMNSFLYFVWHHTGRMQKK